MMNRAESLLFVFVGLFLLGAVVGARDVQASAIVSDARDTLQADVGCVLVEYLELCCGELKRTESSAAGGLTLAIEIPLEPDTQRRNLILESLVIDTGLPGMAGFGVSLSHATGVPAALFCLSECLLQEQLIAPLHPARKGILPRAPAHRWFRPPRV